MIKCISRESLEASGDIEQLLQQARQRGFAGLELSVEEPRRCGEEITARCNELLKNGTQAILPICSLTTPSVDVFSLAAGDEHTRTAALETVEVLIQTAAHLRAYCPQGDMCVVVGAETCRGSGTTRPTSYEALLNGIFVALEQVAQSAERLSVPVAIENPKREVLLSPLEVRELIDEVNSPYVGVCFNPRHAEQLGDPCDWLDILGGRVFVVHLPLTDAAEQAGGDCETIISQLEKMGFSGPVVYGMR